MTAASGLRATVLIPFMIAGALALFPLVGEPFYVELVVRLMILAVLAMSLDLLVGTAGMVSLGHAAFFGVGAYTLALLTPEIAPVSLWWSLPAAMLVAGAAALVIGALAIRTSGASFIMITLAFAQMAFYLASENAAFGGSDGLFVWHPPSVAVGDVPLLDLADPVTFYFVVLGAVVITYVLLAAVRAAPFGRVLTAIRIDPGRARALGYPVLTYKLIAFLIAGTLAGLAGYLEAIHSGYVSPGLMSWHQSGLVLVIVILGGAGSLYGPVLAAFVLGLARDQIQDVTEHWSLALGLLIILLVLALPRGLAGLTAGKRQSP